MKNQKLKQIGITVLGWLGVVVITANIASAINPSSDPANISAFESLLCMTIVLGGWVPFYLYFKKKNKKEDNPSN